jgi:hypothetical protein
VTPTQNSSAIALWAALGLIAVGLVVMWAVPQVPVIVGTVLVGAGALTGVLAVLKKRLTPEKADEHEEAAPLHLRD